ncbi:hypothetical protein [Crossiella cryophila]|uniref:Uncharacterized protein n=1 Tax=Crossiella cryophila TaxID=43355 RepID=A0A7W7FTA7_9PSEU|nr:hypothetical protein [Crossiella cryophila]MBB4676820.1 hypothetical protein [Crossiella cryophila]
MPTFDGREIEVIQFSDLAGEEWVYEFRDPAWDPNSTMLAIAVPDAGTWADAVVSINPHKGDLPLRFLEWAVRIAAERERPAEG